MKDLNLQPTVLETATLPIELTPCSLTPTTKTQKKVGGKDSIFGIYPPLPLENLSHHLGDAACTNGATTFADGEAETLLHGDRGEQLDLDRHVVTRHDHLDTFRQRD